LKTAKELVAGQITALGSENDTLSGRVTVQQEVRGDSNERLTDQAESIDLTTRFENSKAAIRDQTSLSILSQGRKLKAKSLDVIIKQLPKSMSSDVELKDNDTIEIKGDKSNNEV
jgi:hypothetical protein